MKEELFEGSHEAMITKKTFDKIQRRLEKNPQKINYHNNKDEEKDFYFTGLARCGFCGYAITKEWHKKKSEKIFKYYRCSRKSKICKCTEKAINEKELIKQVESLVSQVSIPTEWYKKYASQIDIWLENETSETSRQTSDMKSELVRINDRLDRLLDLQLNISCLLSRTERFQEKQRDIL